MATTRSRRPRKKATPATPVHIGPWLDHEPTDTLHPIRIATVDTWPEAGRRVQIGTLVHRDYESGYPDRWEVSRLGGTAWGWYPTEEAARAAAADYAHAYVTMSGRAGGVRNFVDVANPDPAQEVHHRRRAGDTDRLIDARGRARALLAEADHLAQHIADAGPDAAESAHDRRTAIDHELAELVPDLLDA